ncbi:IS1595 family transposase [Natrinema gelatinilyticum]|uniref:IS1595 family transposase n=1 Tax=Natrinema gelatinilyticum TaxID=2961571 RepID=UPI0020C1EE59|nr:IS1595 family transposase [Natrinema gelatinilyticum]
MSQPAFGKMLQQLVDLGVIELQTKPLDDQIERRLKKFWEQAPCPECGDPSIQTWPSSNRVICRSCGFKPVCTYGTPFHEKHLTTGEVLLAFILYADTLLSISKIATLLDRAYKTVYYAIREVEAAVQRGFPVVWNQFQQEIDGPVQIDESSSVCSGYKGQDPPRDSRHRGGSSRSGRSRWRGRHGDQITLVTACRDVLRVVHGQLGISYETDLDPVIQEAEDLSQPLGEVWTDGLQAYRRMEYTHQIVVHDETYVSPDGVHINQVECLFSLIKPWLRKFRGVSKHGLEQAVHTFGIIRSLNLAGASLVSVIDCLAMGAFPSST